MKGAQVKKTATDITMGAGLGIVADLLTELFRVPVLNDSGTFGNTTISNFEIVAYGLAILGVVAGIMDIIIGKGVISFTRDYIFKLLGFMLGVYYYEHSLADIIGIRKFNQYNFAGQFIPRVLPAGTSIPTVTSYPYAGNPLLSPLINTAATASRVRVA